MRICGEEGLGEGWEIYDGKEEGELPKERRVVHREGKFRRFARRTNTTE